MTPTERRQAILTIIAAKLEDARAGQRLAQREIARRGHLSPRTVWALFNHTDHYVSTLNEVAEAMDCDLVIEIRKRNILP
jgi:transcriptional regulator with XRE-family HTH domain